MAIKGYITADSYTRIERVDVMKDTKTVDYYLTVYKDSDKSEILARDIRFTVKNDSMNKISDYDTIFEPALKTDVNILAICYQQIMQRPEFANTSEV